MLSPLPFVVGAVLAAWFVENLERTMVPALTAVCVAIFWHWPSTRRQQLFTVAAVPLATMAGIVYNLALPHRLLIIAGLSVVAAIAELRLRQLEGAKLPQHARARAESPE